jgi:DNA-binding transcriptional MerR regulator
MPNRTGTAAVNAAGEALPFENDESTTPQMYEYKLMIDVVARMFRVSTFELRMYEMLGLIRRDLVGEDWTYAWTQCERVALIVRGREAGLRLRDIKPMILAMDDNAPPEVISKGKVQTLAMIKRLLAGKSANDRALDELFRVDWELSDRLGVASGSGGIPARKFGAR